MICCILHIITSYNDSVAWKYGCKNDTPNQWKMAYRGPVMGHGNGECSSTVVTVEITARMGRILR